MEKPNTATKPKLTMFQSKSALNLFTPLIK
jgi:hypothetical protein